MKKHLAGLLLISGVLFAQEFRVDVEVNGVKMEDGNVYLAIYSSKETYGKSVPTRGEGSIAYGNTINFDLNLSEGSYVFTSFQDLNGNGQLDYTGKGLPAEPVGIANFDGKGNPMDFDKLKNIIKSDKKIILNLK